MKKKFFSFSLNSLLVNAVTWFLGLSLAFPISNVVDYFPWQNYFSPNFSIGNYQDRQYFLRLVVLSLLNLVVPLAIKIIEVFYRPKVHSHANQIEDSRVYSLNRSVPPVYPIVMIILRSIGIAIAISLLFCLSERYYDGLASGVTDIYSSHLFLQPDFMKIFFYGILLMGDCGAIFYILIFSSYGSYAWITNFTAKYFSNRLSVNNHFDFSLIGFLLFHFLNVTSLFFVVIFITNISGTLNIVTNKILLVTIPLFILTVIYQYLNDDSATNIKSLVTAVVATIAIYVVSVIIITLLTALGLTPWYAILNYI